MNQRLRLLFFAFALGLVQHVLADDQSAWMSRVDDNTFVSQLSIPGAHDAATGHGFQGLYGVLGGDAYARTQDKTITEQWNSGIRAFDFRPCVDGSDLRINHGVIQTKLTLKDALTTLCDLLDQHPTELAIVIIRHETEGDDNNSSWNSMMTSLIGSNPIKAHTVNFTAIAKMSTMRGKLLILSRDAYATSPTGGFIYGWGHNADYSSQQGGTIKGRSGSAKCYIQDFYDCSANGATQTKTKCIQTMLNFSMSENTNPNQWVINHTSGYTSSSSDGYRDNASKQNAVVIEYLSSHTGATGLVMMDYVGVDSSNGYNVKGLSLTKALIANNFKEGSHTAYFRALSTIVTGKKYRVTTKYDGTKYYLTDSGYLNANGAKAGSFTFTRLQGEAYHYGFQLKDSYFTNPGLDAGTVVFKSGHINTYTGSARATWEAQVFYQNVDGKLAIRSTNAKSGTSSWALTAGTYWTVNNGTKGPLAEYSNDQNFIWEIEDASIVPDAIYPIGAEGNGVESKVGDRSGLYDLSGRQVSSSHLVSSTIPKGIYLLKGKKVLIQ